MIQVYCEKCGRENDDDCSPLCFSCERVLEANDKVEYAAYLNQVIALKIGKEIDP